MNPSFKWGWANTSIQKHMGFPIHLSPRQREVLLLLCEGLPNKLIGRRLGLSDATVKCHVASILRSLNVTTRLEAVTLAFQLGLVRPYAGSDHPGRNGDSGPFDLGEALAA